MPVHETQTLVGGGLGRATFSGAYLLMESF